MPRRVGIRRRGGVVALVTSAGIFLAAILQQVLQSLIALAVAPAMRLPAEVVPAYLERAALASLSGVLPLCLGVFLCLWQLAPVAAELRLAHVFTRILLAAAVGAVAVVLVGLVIVLVSAALALGDRGSGQFALTAVAQDAISTIQRAGSTIIDALPLIVLGGVLQWVWLRDRERDYPVEGMIDL